LKHLGFFDFLMKKIGHFSLPSALHANPAVMQVLLDFFPDICFDVRPQSGGALVLLFSTMTFKRGMV
jgi:hypothetical protein